MDRLFIHRAGKILGLVLLLAGCEQPPGDKPQDGVPIKADEGKTRPDLSVNADLEIVQAGESKKVSLAKLLEEVPPEVVETQDPYYETRKKFWALPLSRVAETVFGRTASVLQKEEVELQASDGYRVRLPGRLLTNKAAYFAVAEAESKRFEPIGDQKADPGPLYLIWEGNEFSDEKEFPRPWAVVKMTLLEEGAAWQHLKPKGGFGEDKLAERGSVLFEKDCIRCHSINQDGGKVGPDLNVPRNILSYRPEDQVRAYIVDPKTFRYSTMPAHPNLSDDDIDALIAYLRVMGEHQFDPQKKSAAQEGASP